MFDLKKVRRGDWIEISSTKISDFVLRGTVTTVCSSSPEYVEFRNLGVFLDDEEFYVSNHRAARIPYGSVWKATVDGQSGRFVSYVPFDADDTEPWQDVTDDGHIHPPRFYRFEHVSDLEQVWPAVAV